MRGVRSWGYAVDRGLVASIGPVGPTDEPVGPPNGPDRPAGGRTRHPRSPAQSERLAQLAYFEHTLMRSGETVESDAVVIDGASGDGPMRATP
jgi:hypothetical protein